MEFYSQNVLHFEELCVAVRDLLWYISPHTNKFRSHGATLPTFFAPLFPFNDPCRHKHKVDQLNQQVLLRCTGAVTNLLEKSFAHRSSFANLYGLIDKVVESCAKYSDYLEENLKLVEEYQSREEPVEINKIDSLPNLSELSVGQTYSSKREQKLIEVLEAKLSNVENYDPVNIDEDLLGNRAHRHMFLKHLRENGLITNNVILFVRYYGPALGNTHFIWKEDPIEMDNLTVRQDVIHDIEKKLPKFFSRAHKAKVRELTSLVMLDKMSPAQFRTIYSELTGDYSVTDNTKSKIVDERMQLILKTADPSILRDLRVMNSRKSKFDEFWDVTAKKIEELQLAAVDDRNSRGGGYYQYGISRFCKRSL